MLVTSREPLRAEGEWVHRLAPLDTPSAESKLSTDATDNRNAELFCDRHHNEQKDCEIKSVERPSQPRRDPGRPLIPGRLFPPLIG